MNLSALNKRADSTEACIGLCVGDEAGNEPSSFLEVNRELSQAPLIISDKP